MSFNSFKGCQKILNVISLNFKVMEILLDARLQCTLHLQFKIDCLTASVQTAKGNHFPRSTSDP
jgi:hypothetical protein